MIKLENISKYYYSANSVVPALRKIKLEFGIGEFVVITGESGSGKSTLLNVISGLDTYDDGELYINGEATSHFDDDDWEEYRKNKIGFVFQNYYLIENFSALYNVESSLLIQGYDSKEARNMAKELLAKVGLKGQINQRASKLSSGQKQRLSIARALAKNTDIIVADEPTGNLDTGTGNQVMELFGKLSRDKLIIVVTHNYEETAPYVTRKIRLHDGEIVSDNPVNHGTVKQADAENNTKAAIADITSDTKIAWRFTWMNLLTQPRRAMLFMAFLLFTAAVSFLFLGEIFSNMDDIYTKDYDNKAFLNSDMTRIVVKKPDGSEITKQDMERFSHMKYVEMADQYDYANDINYYITYGTDYDYTYRPNDDPNSSERLYTVNFLQGNKFVKSETCISEGDLKAGRLPSKLGEIVLYSETDSTLGSDMTCYFTNSNLWGYDNYYAAAVKVVGLLKKKSSQVYFSSKLCNMLSLDMYGDSYMMYLSKNIYTNEYNVQLSFVPVIGEGLKDHELKVSSSLADTSVYPLSGESEVYAYHDADENGSDNGVDRYDTTVLEKYNPSSVKFVEISENWFNELYTYHSNQASLYIKDYIYTDKVIKQLEGQGYNAISSYRIGAVKYNDWKVDQRNNTLLKASLVLLVISILEILIIGSFLKIKKNNYDILTSMGMNFKTIKRMNYFEMLFYTAVSVTIVLIASVGMRLFQYEFLSNLLKYYNLKNSIVFITFKIFVIIATVLLFNRYLKRRHGGSI